MIVRYKSYMYPLIDLWYKKRGIKAPARESLSDMGFIADDRVAGWLYLTNSNIAFIEGIIADPDSVPSLRRASLEKVCATMVDTAISLGYTQILGITTSPTIEKLGVKLGFVPTDYKVLILKEKSLEDELEALEDTETELH